MMNALVKLLDSRNGRLLFHLLKTAIQLAQIASGAETRRLLAVNNQRVRSLFERGQRRGELL